MSFTPTIHLDLRTSDVRRAIDVSLAPLSDTDLFWLADVFALVEKGQAMQIGIGHAEDGRHCVQFVIGRGADDGSV